MCRDGARAAAAVEAEEAAEAAAYVAAAEGGIFEGTASRGVPETSAPMARGASVGGASVGEARVGGASVGGASVVGASVVGACDGKDVEGTSEETSEERASKRPRAVSSLPAAPACTATAHAATSGLELSIHRVDLEAAPARHEAAFWSTVRTHTHAPLCLARSRTSPLPSTHVLDVCARQVVPRLYAAASAILAFRAAEAERRALVVRLYTHNGGWHTDPSLVSQANAPRLSSPPRYIPAGCDATGAVEPH